MDLDRLSLMEERPEGRCETCCVAGQAGPRGRKPSGGALGRRGQGRSAMSGGRAVHGRFISRIEDYMKYKPVEVLIFENQQFRLLQLIKKLGRRNLKSFSKVSQSLEIMASDLAQAFATKEEMPASIDEQIEKQRGRAIVSNAEAARELDEKILSNEPSPRSGRPLAQAHRKPLTSSTNFIIDMWEESLQKQRPEVRDLIDSSVRAEKSISQAGKCCFSTKQKADEEETTDGFVTERRDEIQLSKPAIPSASEAKKAPSSPRPGPGPSSGHELAPGHEAPSQLAQLVTQADEKPSQAAEEQPEHTVSPKRDHKGPLPQQAIPLLPPQDPTFRGRKTLVLDLDETLVHSSFTPVKCDLVLSVFLGNEEHKVYVRKRPGVDEFLNAVAKLYEVAIFTASTALYANSLLDVLDKSGWIQHRLFREACTRYKEGYVKDLSLLGRSLNEVIIIDNMPVCYALQPENAIPIRTWKHDPQDTELLDLLPILLTLAYVDQIPRMLKEILAHEASEEDEASEAGASCALARTDGPGRVYWQSEMTAALEPIRLTSFGEAKLAVAEQLCATELEAQSWRLRCFQAEAQLRLQRLQRRGEQHPRWPQDAAAQQQLQNSYAALKALDFTSIVQETLRDVVLTRTSVGHLQDLLEQTSREVAELEEDAATKRARAISLSEGAASEDATFENRERELEEHKEKAREISEKLRQRFVLENDLAEQVGHCFSL
eukprot:s2715_g9.t4